MISASEQRVGIARGNASYASVPQLRTLIRDAVHATLGTELRGAVASGASVLIKPNWVRHYNRSGSTTDCLITHPAFVEAMLLEVLATSPARVIIGDAPLQSADFDRLAPRSWRDHVRELGGTVPVEVRDFRNVITEVQGEQLKAVASKRRPDQVALFDLGPSSLLEAVSRPSSQFRVTSYSPARMAQVQRPGVHKYVICKEPLEADIVVSLPKLKTHCKAGITAALKNLVGINGDKDYLPHHRVGSPQRGGDCYAQPHLGKRAAEVMLDIANSRIGRPGYSALAFVAGKTARRVAPIGIGGLEGAWHGNDTVWRMTLDLNRILRYGRADGTMSDEVQRTVLTITDGVIAGEGEGPMAPTPVDLGVVTCATNPVYADVVHAALMHLDFRRIPLIARAFDPMRWPLVTGQPGDVDLRTLERAYATDEIAALGRRFAPAHGWRGVIEA